MPNSLTKSGTLTPREVREYDERLKLIQEMLARSPYLSKAHFTNHYGCRHGFLKMLEEEHGVQFGKGEKHRIKLSKDRDERTN